MDFVSTLKFSETSLRKNKCSCHLANQKPLIRDNRFYDHSNFNLFVINSFILISITSIRRAHVLDHMVSFEERVILSENFGFLLLLFFEIWLKIVTFFSVICLSVLFHHRCDQNFEIQSDMTYLVAHIICTFHVRCCSKDMLGIRGPYSTHLVQGLGTQQRVTDK